MNKSWRDSLSSIVERAGSNTIILINGVQNSGKSTFASCLVNKLLNREDNDVFLMDLDPGQPNYNLAGQVALLKMDNYILTNADFK
jgi:polynucleotide 5'-kinase involved in rRNA processing